MSDLYATGQAVPLPGLVVFRFEAMEKAQRGEPVPLPEGALIEAGGELTPTGDRLVREFAHRVVERFPGRQRVRVEDAMAFPELADSLVRLRAIAEVLVDVLAGPDTREAFA